VLDGTDGNLWYAAAPFGPTTQFLKIDSNVRYYEAADAQTVFVLRADGSLWYFEQLPVPTIRLQVATNVWWFRVVDKETVFVIGNDALWYTPAPFGEVPNPSRSQVFSGNGDLSDFQAVDGQGAFFKQSQDHLLYIPAPFVIPNPNQQQGYGNVNLINQYQPVDAQKVFVLGADSKLWYFEQVTDDNPQLVDIDVGGASFGGGGGDEDPQG
jgi:hypothetical protein